LRAGRVQRRVLTARLRDETTPRLAVRRGPGGLQGRRGFLVATEPVVHLDTANGHASIQRHATTRGLDLDRRQEVERPARIDRGDALIDDGREPSLSRAPPLAGTAARDRRQRHHVRQDSSAAIRTRERRDDVRGDDKIATIQNEERDMAIGKRRRLRRC
jgi:hypothetical protein